MHYKTQRAFIERGYEQISKPMTSGAQRVWVKVNDGTKNEQ
jgi:hypothetical protein